MVSPVRIRVPPLPVFSGFSLFKPSIQLSSGTRLSLYFSLFRAFAGSVAVRVFEVGDLGTASNVAMPFSSVL
jgi:hypothetical protein